MNKNYIKNIEIYDKNFLLYAYNNYSSIRWRWPLLSIRDLLERIITVQDYDCLKFLFINYKDHTKIIDILFYDLSKIAEFSDEYKEKYNKVINTFNYFRYSWKRWNKDYIPNPIMDKLNIYLKNKKDN